MERPVNKWSYEQSPLAELAAAYAFGLAKNHAFIDGNKRIAFMAMMIFLQKNGVAFAPDPAQATKSFWPLPPARSARKASPAGSGTIGQPNKPSAGTKAVLVVRF